MQDLARFEFDIAKESCFVIKSKQFKKGGEKNHEDLFLPIFVGCSRRCFGHIVVASYLG